MNSTFTISKKKTNTTEKYITILFCFFLIFVPYFIIWILIGEFNLLKLNWFSISKNGSNYIFKIDILYWMLGVILLSIFSFLLLFYIKNLIKIDAIPFIFLSHVMCITAITSGLIPYNQSNKIFIIIARFIIVVVSSFISFFILNALINKLNLSSNNSYLLYKEFSEDSKKQKDIEDEIDSLKSKEKSYIEIERE